MHHTRTVPHLGMKALMKADASETCSHNKSDVIVCLYAHSVVSAARAALVYLLYHLAAGLHFAYVHLVRYRARANTQMLACQNAYIPPCCMPCAFQHAQQCHMQITAKQPIYSYPFIAMAVKAPRLSILRNVWGQ